ncbi:pyk [Acrasis kona]|uniref:Pyk n=1 Tax=Acrasis kona TaxID=1008807 RepID=A0AAW2ZMD3_9EUKA
MREGGFDQQPVLSMPVNDSNGRSLESIRGIDINFGVFVNKKNQSFYDPIAVTLSSNVTKLLFKPNNNNYSVTFSVMDLNISGGTRRLHSWICSQL